MSVDLLESRDQRRSQFVELNDSNGERQSFCCSCETSVLDSRMRLKCVGIVFWDDVNAVGGLVLIDQIGAWYYGFVVKSNGSLSQR